MLTVYNRLTITEFTAGLELDKVHQGNYPIPFDFALVPLNLKHLALVASPDLEMSPKNV